MLKNNTEPDLSDRCAKCRRRAMTEEEFISYILSNNPAYLDAIVQGRRVIIPCDCEDEICLGWAAVPVGQEDTV